MTQRISLNEVFAQVRTAMARNYASLFRSQTQISTGVRIQRPSDDPVGTRRLLQIGDQQAGIARYLGSVDTARAFLDTAAGSAQQISDSLARVRELATQGANGVLSDPDRGALASEVDGLLATIVQMANAQVEGRYVFAGTNTTTAPFRLGTGADGLTRVDYLGNSEVQQVEVGPGVRSAMNVPGSEVFAAGPRGATAFRGATGAAPGQGVDSGVGRDLLVLAHTQTLYGSPPSATGQDPVTGLRAGAASPAGDTVLGLSHQVVLTTDAAGNGTISLDGGPDLAFTAGATNVQVDGPNGERIFVDLSGVAANLPPTAVALQGRGTFSTDGGQSTVPIDFTANGQQVVDAETGAVLHVNATGIRLAGQEEVTYGGAFDLFSSIVAIRDVLRDPTLSQTERSTLINARIAELDRGTDTLTGALGTLGTRSAQLQTTESRLSELDTTLSRVRSTIQDADISSLVVDINEQQTLYQSSLLMASRVNELSLLRYL